jgi:hypothetical protein
MHKCHTCPQVLSCTKRVVSTCTSTKRLMHPMVQNKNNKIHLTHPKHMLH